ncbi:LEPR-XLL domain-containing protein [Thermodesulfobacteriota bacterium]
MFKIFAFLGLEPRLMLNADLTGQAKLNVFQRSLVFETVG